MRSARHGREGSTRRTEETFPWRKALPLLAAALSEDLGRGDVTTAWLVPAREKAEGVILFRETAVVAGLEVAWRVWRLLDRDVRLMTEVEEGDEAGAGIVVARLEGKKRALLTGERTALNFLQRISGIATLTREFVRRVQGTGARILDTRKTAPGLRIFDRYAVRLGGGTNHRWGLSDMVLVKENHMRGAISHREACERVMRRNTRGLPLEIEVKSLDELRQVLGLPLARIMLDNMSIREMRAAVKLVHEKAEGKTRPLLEASGNITLETVRGVARTGVDFISVGALTHSVRAIDVSFLIE